MAWLVVFLCVELPAAAKESGTGAVKTLSRHVWKWLDRWWKVGIFVAFWVSLGLHLIPQIKATVVPVAVFGAALGLVIAWSEFFGSSGPAVEGQVGWIKSVAGKVWGGLKGAGGWALKRGPLWSALLQGAAAVVPGAAGVLGIVAAAVAGASGGTVDQQTVALVSDLLTKGLLLIGAVRKFWALARPQLLK